MFPTSRQSNYTLDGIYTPGGLVLMIITFADAPRSWTNTFNWMGYTMAPGEHSVVGIVEGHGSSSPVRFTVIPTPKPQADFLVDFDHWPGSTTAIESLASYEAYGIQFRTSLGAAPRYSEEDGDYFVSGFDPYPIGFNVAADFSIPVIGARAHVAGASTCTMTMTAKDAQGQMLASVISPLLGTTGQVVELRTETPIASLEWFPSQANSGVEVDDLLVRIPPILNPSASAGTFCLTWPTITGEYYRVWSSSNLLDWVPAGEACESTSGVLTKESSMMGSTSQFYRVSRVKQP